MKFDLLQFTYTFMYPLTSSWQVRSFLCPCVRLQDANIYQVWSDATRGTLSWNS